VKRIFLAGVAAVVLLFVAAAAAQAIAVNSRPVSYILAGFVVLTIWAVCYRSQLESGKFSLSALAVLVSMEAALFAAMRVFESIWAFH
jgi:hypothetical protein